MTDYEKDSPNVLHYAGSYLRDLIVTHPDYPLLVLAGQDAACPDYSYTACTSVCAELGEFLDCNQQIAPERVFYDRKEFAELLEKKLSDAAPEALSDEVLGELVKCRLAEYESYWTPCIIIWADN